MMRPLATTVVMLTLAASTRAQFPPPGLDRDKLRDQTLKSWETAMVQVKALDADCVRTTEDKIFNTKEVYSGRLRYLKADGATPRCASVKLTSAANPSVYEEYVLNGPKMYEYSPANKVIRVHDLPPPGAGVDANELLLGMTAANALARFKVELIPSPDPQQNQHYWMLRFEPKNANDKASFAAAEIFLLKKTNLPRQIRLRQVNGNSVTWDLPRVDTAAQLRVEHFQPRLPEGWKWNETPAVPPVPRP